MPLLFFSQLVNNDKERILPAAERDVRFCLVTLCWLRAERPAGQTQLRELRALWKCCSNFKKKEKKN